MSTDISAIIKSFFVRYSQEFRQGKLEAFEVIMALAMILSPVDKTHLLLTG